MKKQRHRGKTTLSILNRLNGAIAIIEDLQGYCSNLQQKDIDDVLDAMYDAHARMGKLARLARMAYGKENYRTVSHPCGRAILRAYRKMKGEKKK